MKILFPIAIFISLSLYLSAQTSISYEERIKIAEAYTIAGLYGNKLWEDWDKAPFALLLVYDENEFLINHPSPSEDFKLLGFDSLLNSNVYYRKRVFNKEFLATFPAVSGLATIVVGTPENTGKSSSEWIITILHEHFHQYQYSQPDYYSSVNELDLSGGDETGMWMLNYPFPYEDEEINKQFKILIEALLKVAVPFPQDSRLFNSDLNSYIDERENFKNLLNEKDYKYFSFQIWQEGIARYTEYKITDLISLYEPSEEIKSLKDYKPFNETANELRENIFSNLKEWSATGGLKEKGRLCFYSYGAAEGLLLDRVNKSWREKYFDNKFFIEKSYPD